MNKRLVIFIGFILLGVMVFGVTPKSTPAQSNPPGETIPYSGQLTDAAGQPVVNGQYDLLFELFDASTAGQRLWSETQIGVTVKDSQIRTALGVVTPFPTNLSSASKYWLAVSVRGPQEKAFTVLEPRQPLTSARTSSVQAASALTCPHVHFDENWSGSNPNIGLRIENNGTGRVLLAVGHASDALFGAIDAVNNGIGYGIHASSTLGIGVDAHSQGGHAIDAETTAPGQSSVYAHTTATNANGIVSNSSSGYGVYATSNSGSGLTARSTNNFAIQAGGKDAAVDLYGDILLEGTHGEIFSFGADMDMYTNGSFYIYLDNDNNSTSDYFGIWNSTGSLAFSVTEGGNTYASGTKSATVKTTDFDQRLVYSMESPEVWLEDFGTAQLAAGTAKVFFDPIFGQTINAKVDYHVYVTPLCNEAVLLFVSAKTEQGFTVQGVTLTNQPTNCSFDYRIVAKRLGYEDKRLDLDTASRTKGVQP